MISKSVVLFFLAVLFSGSSFANHCPIDMKKIDKALAKNPAISVEQLSRVKELRSLGAEQHSGGQHGASVDTLAEAMEILGID
jgi:hypothetical protein